jgi:cob(I)alamin adenosyltransferase
MKIYTRGGDSGQTSLIYGRRIRKDDVHVEAYGTVDEANSCIGWALANLPDDDTYQDLRTMCHSIQRDLFDVGRDLATPPDKRNTIYVTDADVQLLEQMIDRLDTHLPPLTQFILPGGQSAGAAFHLARTVVRRAERRVVTVSDTDQVSPVIGKYLNRLSDFLFVAARVVNARMGVSEATVDFQGEKVNPLKDDNA